MAKLNIVTSEGILLDQIDLAGYDLRKPLARADVMDAIIAAIEAGQRAGYEPKGGK